MDQLPFYDILYAFLNNKEKWELDENYKKFRELLAEASSVLQWNAEEYEGLVTWKDGPTEPLTAYLRKIFGVVDN